jgi:hypothetical protein
MHHNALLRGAFLINAPVHSFEEIPILVSIILQTIICFFLSTSLFVFLLPLPVSIFSIFKKQLWELIGNFWYVDCISRVITELLYRESWRQIRILYKFSSPSVKFNILRRYQAFAWFEHVCDRVRVNVAANNFQYYKLMFLMCLRYGGLPQHKQRFVAHPIGGEEYLWACP